MKATLTLPAQAPPITRASAERGAWRSFLAGMGALAVAFGLAIYSGVAAEAGSLWTSAASGLGALALAGWTAVTTVPALARRTPLRWLAYQVDYRVTRQGVIYLVGVFAVALAALNTGNNLLFLMVGCMLAVILLSGILSRITLTGVEISLELPEHVFAHRPAPALLELRNLKQTMPSFSLLVLGAKNSHTKKPISAGALLSEPQRIAPDISGNTGSGAVLRQPVYFPYLSRRQSQRQEVELDIPATRRISAENSGAANPVSVWLSGKNAQGSFHCRDGGVSAYRTHRSFLRNSSVDQRRTGKFCERPRARSLRDTRSRQRR